MSQAPTGSLADPSPGAKEILIPAALPQAVAVVVAAYARHRRRLVVIEVMAGTVIQTVVGVGVIACLDHQAWIGPRLRILLSAGLMGSVVWRLVWRGLRPMLRHEDPVQVARSLEQAAGGLEERLSTALSFHHRPPPGTSRWMVARTLALAASDAVAINPKSLIDRSPARRRIAIAAAITGIMLIALSWSAPRDLLVRALWPWSSVPRPSGTRFVIAPGDTVVARGGPLVIAVRTVPMPPVVGVEIDWSDGLREHVSMAGDGDGSWRLVMPAVTRGFSYQVVSGRAESPIHQVSVVDPPVIDNLSLEIHPPAYTDLPPSRIPAGDIDVVAGSRVTVSASFTGPAVDGVLLVRPGREDLPMGFDLQGRASARFQPEETQIWGLRLFARGGLIVEFPQRWQVTVHRDDPPTAHLSAPGLGAGLAAMDSQIVLRTSAVDDHGLARLDLVLVSGRGDIERRPLLAQGEPARHSVDRGDIIELSELGAESGDSITMSVEAEDQGGQIGISPSVVITMADGDAAFAAVWAERLRTELGTFDAVLSDLRSAERQWGQMQRAYRPEDATAVRGEALLLGERLAEIGERVGDLAGRVRAQSLANDLELAQPLLTLSDQLGAWSAIQKVVLGQASMLAAQEAQLGDLVRGRDLTEAAHAGLQELRQPFGLTIAALEAEGLAGAGLAAADRCRRAVPILRGYAAWREPPASPGLAYVVRSGIVIGTGEVLAQGLGLPSVEGILPTGRQSDLCVEWRGEILIDRGGPHEVTVLVDDGAKVRIDGRDLLPAASWNGQAPTPYRGEANLKSGWHPIEIDFFQGGGPFVFTFGIGRVGSEAAIPDRGHLRSRVPVGDDVALLAAMVDSSPGAATRAREAVVSALRRSAVTGDRLAKLGSEAGRDALLKLAHNHRPDAAMAVRFVERPELLEIAEPADVVAVIERIAQMAVAARDILVTSALRGRIPPAPLALERAVVADVQSRARLLAALRGTLPEADRVATVRRELAASRATAAGLQDLLDQRRTELLGWSRLPTALLDERAAVLAGREVLAGEVDRSLHALLEVLEQDDQSAKGLGERLERATKELDRSLSVAADRLERAGSIRSRGRLQDLRIATLVAIGPGSPAPQRAQIPQDLTARLAVVLADLRTRGHFTSARSLAQAAQIGDGSLLAELAAAEAGRSTGSEGPVPAALSSSAAIRAVEISPPARRREELEATASSAAVAAASHLIDAPDLAFAHIDLGRDAERLAADLDPSPWILEELAVRAEELVSGRPMREGLSPPADSLFMADLADDLRRAAEDPTRRPQAREDLAQVAGAVQGSAEGGISAVNRRLTTSLQDMRLYFETERLARETFAIAEERAAEAYARLAERWPEEGRALLLDAARAARRRGELAQASEGLPGAGAPALHREHERTVAELREKVLIPMARRILGWSEAGEGREELSEVALGLAEVIGQEAETSRRYGLVIERGDQLRATLAQALSAAGARVERGSSGPDLLPPGIGSAVAAALVPGSGAIEDLDAGLAGLEHTAMGRGAQAQGYALVADAARRLAAGSEELRAPALDRATVASLALRRVTADQMPIAMMMLNELELATEAPAPSAPKGLLPTVAGLIHAAPEDPLAWRRGADLLMGGAIPGTGSASEGGSSPMPAAPTEPPAPDPFLTVIPLQVDERTGWARSLEDRAVDVEAPGAEAFPGEQQEAIRAYFRHLADQP